MAGEAQDYSRCDAPSRVTPIGIQASLSTNPEDAMGSAARGLGLDTEKWGVAAQYGTLHSTSRSEKGRLKLYHSLRSHPIFCV
jgi:hypothetical protein